MALKARIENGIVYSPYPSESPPEISLYQAMKQSLEQHGNRTALVWNDEKITFTELLRMLQRYAAGFQGYGVTKGEKVLVHLDNSLENVIAMLSIIFAGGVAVVSYPMLSNDDIYYRIKHSKLTHILTTESEATRFSDMPGQLDIKRFFTVGNAPGFVSVTEFKNLNEDTYQEFPVEDAKNELAALIYTSGTTGHPKAVEFTHFSIVSNLPQSRFHDLYNDHDVIILKRDITWASGFRTLLRACSSGAKIVLLPGSASTIQILEAIIKNKVVLINPTSTLAQVTTVAGNATIMLALARKIEHDRIQMGFVKKVLISGAETAYETLKSLEPVFDLSIVKDIYGATETGEICRPPMDAVKWYGIGFPALMVQIQIVDIKCGKVLGPNEKGEALVKSPYCMRGYYENPEATSQAITADGWVRTGDMCYYNEDGQFFFVERMNDLFKAMGILVAPSSIERVLLSHKGIAEAVVIGVPHPEYSQVAGAFVVLKTESRNITEVELKNFVAGQLGFFMHLHGGVKFVQKIPKDASGKVNRKELVMYRQDS